MWFWCRFWKHFSQLLFSVFADELFKVHKFKPTQDWRHNFDNYLKSMPVYYAQVRHNEVQVQIQVLYLAGWGLNKHGYTWQTAVSDEFSWRKMVTLWMKITHLRVLVQKLTYSVTNQVSAMCVDVLLRLWPHVQGLMYLTRLRPNWIRGPGPKSEPAGKLESRGPENWVSRWRRPNLDIYSQNHHFGLVYDMIYQFLGKEF